MAAQENYTPGHTAGVVNFMARRTADSHAAFVLPLLRPGLRLLDCGCGPGTITVGLAQRVMPGEVIGIDSGSAQLDLAREAGRAANARCTFREADIYDLPFGNSEFDGVFSHALFEHLHEPLRALAEVRRVLKFGGFVALRSPDWGGFVLHPWSDELARALTGYQAIQRANGGDPQAGRKLGAWLRRAGFNRVASSASYEIYSSPSVIAEYLAQQLDAKGLSVAAQALQRWAQEPEAMFAQAWFEAIGWAP